MKLHELSPAPGSVRDVKRIGRGHGSGQGKTAAGKGHKGQKARAGRGMQWGFEGGQWPSSGVCRPAGLSITLRTRYTAVNVAALNAFEDGATVDTEALKKGRSG